MTFDEIAKVLGATADSNERLRQEGQEEELNSTRREFVLMAELSTTITRVQRIVIVAEGVESESG